MNLGIDGRHALVVGASRGIGMEIARELFSEGCKITAVARSMPQVNGWECYPIDMTPTDAPQYLQHMMGKRTPDIIVHVLGGSQGITSTLAPASDWIKVWRLNLGIAHDLNRLFLPVLQCNKWGRIIHLSSNATRIGTGYAPYTSAKAALEGYVKSVSREFSKDGVIVTAVAPGIVHTEGRYYARLDSKEQEAYFNKYIPTHRFGRAEEVAKVVAFLASEHAAYMAGSIVQIDGGAR